MKESDAKMEKVKKRRKGSTKKSVNAKSSYRRRSA
jgi:hypothetical protein